ncbi:putrescine ABC transporter permease PotI, partial [Francisella tularensis subsp. holarctica]|nr:putrescine ABC transporter permease PotI [Francisella tularensis subsp. holarctica]
MLILGLIFLYITLIIIVVFSFSNYEIINLWCGFTFDWYYEVIHDEYIINSTFTRLKIATINSAIATILGTIIAYAIN